MSNMELILKYQATTSLILTALFVILIMVAHEVRHTFKKVQNVCEGFALAIMFIGFIHLIVCFVGSMPTVWAQ